MVGQPWSAHLWRPRQPVGFSRCCSHLCFLASFTGSCVQPACSAPTAPPTGPPPGEPSGPPSTAQQIPAALASVYHWGWWVFVSHSNVCWSVCRQMSVGVNALCWVTGVQRRMGRSFCSQAGRSCPHRARWGGGTYSAGDTEAPRALGPALLLSEVQLHCRHRGSLQEGSSEGAAVTSAPTARCMDAGGDALHRPSSHPVQKLRDAQWEGWECRACQVCPWGWVEVF